MAGKRAGKKKGVFKSLPCCSGVRPAMLSLLVISGVALVLLWKSDGGGSQDGMVPSEPASAPLSTATEQLQHALRATKAKAELEEPDNLVDEKLPAFSFDQKLMHSKSQESTDRIPVPTDKTDGACDTGIKQSGVKPSCVACNRYFDGRPRKGNVKNCTFVPSRNNCYTAEYAQGQGWTTETTCQATVKSSTTEQVVAVPTPGHDTTTVEILPTTITARIDPPAETPAPAKTETSPQKDPPVEPPTPAKAEEATPEVPAPDMSKPQTKMEDCNIFTLWEYPKGAPLYVRLNVESWRRHSYGRCGEPIFVNESNIKTWIPDLPEEYFRLPYQAAKSDVVRYAVIYHHGGLYLDTDFLIVGDLDPVLDVLHTDLVSYSNKHLKPDGTECPRDFSSNFIGGRKGSAFHKAIWEEQKRRMRKHCPASRKGKANPHTGKAEFCCFKDPQVLCDVPWAGIGEATSHDELDKMRRTGQAFTSHCFAGDDSFVPWEFEGVLQHAPGMTDAVARFARFNVKKPLDRIAYHLFNSLTALSSYTCKKLSSTTSLMGNLYRKSFETGRGKYQVQGPLADAFLKQFPQFKEHSQKHEDVVPCRKTNRFESLLSSLPAPSGSSNSSKCKLFTIAYPGSDVIPLAARLNLESWRRHTAGLCEEPILIDDENVRQFIPDLPDEYFRLPGIDEKLDFLRHGLIYHHGGAVFQRDVVLTKNLSPLVSKLAKHDLVTTTEPKGDGTACVDAVQGAFVGGRRGSLFHGAAWLSARETVMKHCPLSDKDKEKVCCFDQANINCHIPGSALGEGFTQNLKKEFEGDEQVLKSYCLSGAESFRAPHFQFILDHLTNLKDGAKKFKDEHKKHILDNLAYFIPLGQTRNMRCKALFNELKVIGAIYAKSFNVAPGTPKDDLPCGSKQSKVMSMIQTLPQPAGFEDGKTCNIFSIEVPAQDSNLIAAKLNTESWRRHAAGFCNAPVLISDGNVKDWLPDLPDEYFRLPGNNEKLDFIRHGLIYHHGGVVLSREVVFTKSFESISSVLSKYDLVSSMESKSGSSSECGDGFQVFFTGGRKGSNYHAAAWAAAKEAVTKHCPESDRPKEILCCFDDPNSQCHIPGGRLSESHSSKMKMALEADDVELLSHCFSETNSFRPAYLQFVLDHKPKLKDAVQYFKKERKMDLLNRPIFFIPFGDTRGRNNCMSFFENKTLVGAIYSMSFSAIGEAMKCPLRS